MKLNIIYLSFYALPSRGTHNIQIMNMCSAFSKIPGLKITLIAPMQSDQRSIENKYNVWNFYGLQETFKIHFTPNIFNIKNKGKIFFTIYKTILTFLFSLNIMRKINDDFIIYSRAPKTTCLASFILQSLRINSFKGYFLELHNLPKSSLPLINAKGLITISAVLKKDILLKYETLNEQKIFVAHDGVNLDFKIPTDSIHDIRKRHGLPLDNIIITYAGRIMKGKGVDILIKAFSRLENNFNIFLLLIGKVYDNYYYQLANELGIKNIKFTGFIPPVEVKNYLYCSDILVLPSTEELPYAKYTSPLKLFEYMSLNKPIVASSLESIREVIKNEENGLLYENLNVDMLTNCLSQLINNESKTKFLADNALNNCKNYTWDNRALNIINFINTLLCRNI